MKKTFLILFFIAFTTTSFCQEKYAVEFSYEEWSTWTNEQKEAYIIGFSSGLISTLQKVVYDYPELLEYADNLSKRISNVKVRETIKAINTLYREKRYQEAPINALIVNIKYLIKKEQLAIE